MQISDQFKISVSDLSVISGTEHYAVTVHRGVYNDITKTTDWSLELEMNGLATSSSGNISTIGTAITGHEIKAYIRLKTYIKIN